MSRSSMRTLLLIAIVASGCSNRSTMPSIGGNGGHGTPYVLQGGGCPTNWTRFSPSTYGPQYLGIVNGPDKNIWFLDYKGPGLARLSMVGGVTEYPLPLGPHPYFPIAMSVGRRSSFDILTASCSGDYNGAVDFVKTNGVGHQYQLPTHEVVCTAGSGAVTIASGSDGNAWVVGYNHIIRVSPAGAIQVYPYPSGQPNGDGAIAAGPNGDLWFYDNGTSSIGFISPTTGDIVEYPISPPGGTVTSIVAPPDGNLWFNYQDGGGSNPNPIVRMTPTGNFSYFNEPDPSIVPGNGAVGSGGFVYFSTSGFDAQPGLLRVNTNTGAITYLPSPYGSDSLSGVAAGADGNFWMSTEASHIDVYIKNVLTVTPTSLNFSSPQLQSTITAKETGKPTLTAASSNVGIATVGAGQNANTFVVTSQAVGYCTITIQDSKGNSFDVPVTVQ